MLARWINAAWRWKCSGEAAAYRRACTNVAQTQSDLLLRLLRANENSGFGREHGFDRIRNVREYQQRVPVRSWDDFAPYIARICTGEKAVLTEEPVLLLEPTSGTTSGEKLIPYTRTLRHQFQRGIAAWIHDLLTHYPAAAWGRAYWSISPALGRQRRTAGGIPIGFDDDTAYLGYFEQAALRHVLAVPGAVARLPDVVSVRYATLLGLLAAKDLSLISVWGPTFLTTLLQPLRAWAERLVHDLRLGYPSLHLRPSRSRSEEVASLLRSDGGEAGLCRALWPQLGLISCWADAAAAHFVPQLRQLFPDTPLQGKGLLATEGFVSLPLAAERSAALAVRSHFFEFAEAGVPERVVLAHQLDLQGRYRVLITTGGGLYRYDLGDEVEVVGCFGQTPLLRFIGRSSATSDLVGEKLSEAHVASAMQQALAAFSLAPRFVLLVPRLQPAPGYCLLVQGLQSQAAVKFAETVEARLKKNPYYAHAVGFGQLLPLQIIALKPDASAWLLYEAECLKRGQRAGDVKPALLASGTGWLEAFRDAIMPGLFPPEGHARSAAVAAGPPAPARALHEDQATAASIASDS